MTDNKKKRGSPDSKEISTKEKYEIRDWAKALDVPQAKVIAAVKKVGHSAAKVKKYLKGK